MSTETVSEGDGGNSSNMKAFIGVGLLAAVGGVSYLRWRAPQLTQALWTDRKVGCKCVCCVNFPAELEEPFRKALALWFTDDELRVDFHTVTLFEDVYPTTESLVSATKTNTRFSYAELAARDLPHQVDCVVHYRKACKIDNGIPASPEGLSTDAKEAVRHQSGALYTERHCICYSMDGVAVEGISRSTTGIIDAQLLDGLTNEFISGASLSELFMRCLVPTHGIIDSLRSDNKVNDSDAAGEPESFAVAEDASRTAPGHCAVWLKTAPFFLFCNLGARLRYARQRFDGVQQLLMPRNVPRVLPAWLERFLWGWTTGASAASRFPEAAAWHALTGEFVASLKLSSSAASHDEARVAEQLAAVTRELHSVKREILGAACGVSPVVTTSDGQELQVRFGARCQPQTDEKPTGAQSGSGARELCSVLQAVHLSLSTAVIAEFIGFPVMGLRLSVGKGGCGDTEEAETQACLLYPSPSKDATEAGDIFASSLQEWGSDGYFTLVSVSAS